VSTSERRIALRVRALLGERRGRDAVGAVATATPRGRAQDITIRVGGPLDGTVTLTATDSPRIVVEARWGRRNHREHISLTRLGESAALLLADAWTNLLIDGREPTRDLLRHQGDW
jgi:hypothetical protein